MSAFHLRLKLFLCGSCGWQGQTYAQPHTDSITCPDCKLTACEIPAKFNEAENKLVPLEPS